MPVDPTKRGSKEWQKHEYQLQKARGEPEKKARAARAKARAAYDAKGIDRAGKDIAHTKALSNGGSADLSNTKLTSVHANRAFSRKGGGGKNAHKPVK
jgi:hypothetical protein